LNKNINLSQYYDSFFSSIGLLCGGILIFQGWRLDPILLLSQILLSGTAIFFIAESLYLRNNKFNFKIFSKKKNNFFILEKKNLKKKTNYKKIKLIKKHYKEWEKIDYTFFISYTI
jgi:hypothetical protein